MRGHERSGGQSPERGTVAGAEDLLRSSPRKRGSSFFNRKNLDARMRPDLVVAAREAADCRFDLLVACAFSYDAHASELTRLGPLPILQAEIDADAWGTLYRDTSRPFARPETGRIAATDLP